MGIIQEGGGEGIQGLIVTRSHKMVYKSHFGTIEIYIYILKEEKMLIIVVKK